MNFIDRGTSNKKTNSYDVTSKANGSHLGRVYFYPRWRKFVFEPATHTLYDAVCLAHISGFIDGLTDEWRRTVIARNKTKKAIARREA